VLAGDLSPDSASLAHADLLALRVVLFPYALLADRCWQLRDNVTTYDAAYIALAEQLDATLATLDARLARSSGQRCEFATPEEARRS
jgi:predicted nucleic acid-binding protein